MNLVDVIVEPHQNDSGNWTTTVVTDCWGAKQEKNITNKKRWMEDKIFDILTDLIRDDISKNEAIDKLSVLFGVINSFPENIDEKAKLKDKIYSETIGEMDMETVEDAYECGIENAIHKIYLNR